MTKVTLNINRDLLKNKQFNLACCVLSSSNLGENRIYNSIATIMRGLSDYPEIGTTIIRVHFIHDYFQLFNALACSFQKLFWFKMSKIIRVMKK